MNLATPHGLASAGVRWSCGEATLFGEAHAFVEALDARIASWAAADDARPLQPGACIDVETLARLGWFQAFPHLATVPVSLDEDPANLEAFRGAAPTGCTASEGTLPPACWSAPRHVLTPAACYHVWPLLAGDSLECAETQTLRARCFRREREFVPLRRQASFEMRELVRVGPAAELVPWLARRREQALGLAADLGLDVQLERATDPFFDPGTQPAHALQLAAPLKLELVTPDGLALASFNRHHQHFGRAFDVRIAGTWAASACAAFGLERWLAAVIDAHGFDARNWPEVPRD